VRNSYVAPDLEKIRREIKERGWAGWECVLFNIIDAQRREIENMRRVKDAPFG